MRSSVTEAGAAAAEPTALSQSLAWVRRHVGGSC